MDLAILSIILTIIGVVATLIGSEKIAFYCHKIKYIGRENRGTKEDEGKDSREVEYISTEELCEASNYFVKHGDVEIDLIVAIKPGGELIAQDLARKLDVELGFLTKEYTNGSPSPFFIFQGHIPTRSDRKSKQKLSRLPRKLSPSKVLIVDAVSTFGNAFANAEIFIQKKYPESTINFLAYAIDEPRLSASLPSIYKRTYTNRKFDNFQIWLTFPWEQCDG